MFITSRLDPGELLALFLDLEGGDVDKTAEFSAYKHDKDLCPRFRSQIGQLLSTYNRYRTGVSDIQGFTDDGVDVLLTYCDAHGQQRKAGLQIKSHDEFKIWKRNSTKKTGAAGTAAGTSSMVEKLVAQSSRAKNNAGVDDYYIVLCTDESAHQKRIRQITSAFKNYSDVKVVTPVKAFAFLEMASHELSLKVTRVLCADDPLFQAVRAELGDLDPPQLRALIHLARRAFEDETQGDVDRLIDFLESAIDDDMAMIISDFEAEGYVQFDGTGYQILMANLPASLCALYFDQRHRYQRSGAELESYLYDLIRLK